MNHVTLYEYEDSNIKISMEIYFDENDKLKFAGYDTGKTVERLMGDSDYEYYYTIEYAAVKKLAQVLNVDYNDKASILNEIKQRFNGNEAYSRFGAFMKENDIAFEAFTWR
jgi:hypothetical protein